MSETPARRFGPARLTAGVVLTSALVGAAWLWWPIQSMIPDMDDDGTVASLAPKVPVEVPQSWDPDGGITEPLLNLARRAPEKAWVRAAAMERSAHRESNLKRIAALWVQQNPNAAMSAFEAMDEDFLPTDWSFEMLARWMVADAEAAVDWALSTSRGRPPLLITGAIDWLFEHSEPRAAVLALAQRVFRDWAGDEPAEAWQAAAASRLAGERGSLRVVAEVWFEVDPRAALDAAVSSDAWQYRSEPWVPALAAKWAATAPHEAAAWALALARLPQLGAVLTNFAAWFASKRLFPLTRGCRNRL